MKLQRPPSTRTASAAAVLAAPMAIPENGPITLQRAGQVVAEPDRSAADRANDARRKPAQLLAFIGVQPGIEALDVSTGGGYTAELLARAIGANGMVYGQFQPRDAGRASPKPAAPEGGAAPMADASASAPAAAPRRTSADALADRERELLAGHVDAAPIVPVAQRFDNPVPPALTPGKLDLVTLMFNYHDLGFMGVDRAAMNRAIFEALKPGGFYVIADHAGRPGTGIGESGTLHRIEESFLRAEVEAAGFKLADEGFFLHNPDDPRDQNTPNPPQPKDEFVLKFVKTAN
jgi:predicted methyltransferase